MGPLDFLAIAVGLALFLMAIIAMSVGLVLLFSTPTQRGFYAHEMDRSTTQEVSSQPETDH